MASKVNSTKQLKRENSYPFQTIPINFKERSNFKLIISDQPHPDIKTRKKYHKMFTGHYHWWMQLPKFLREHKKINFTNTLKGLYTIINWDISQRCKDDSINGNQSVWYTTLTNWNKNKIISIDAKQIFGGSSIFVFHKSFTKWPQREASPKSIIHMWETHCWHYILFNGWVILHCVYVPQLSYIFNGEKQKEFPLRSEMRPGCSLSPLQST